MLLRIGKILIAFLFWYITTLRFFFFSFFEGFLFFIDVQYHWRVCNNWLTGGKCIHKSKGFEAVYDSACRKYWFFFFFFCPPLPSSPLCHHSFALSPHYFCSSKTHPLIWWSCEERKGNKKLQQQNRNAGVQFE